MGLGQGRGRYGLGRELMVGSGVATELCMRHDHLQPTVDVQLLVDEHRVQIADDLADRFSFNWRREADVRQLPRRFCSLRQRCCERVEGLVGVHSATAAHAPASSDRYMVRTSKLQSRRAWYKLIQAVSTTAESSHNGMFCAMSTS